MAFFHRGEIGVPTGIYVRGARSPLPDRFWAKVNKDGPIHPTLGTECWIWTGCKTRFGHGQIGRGGRGTGLIPSHRVSWEMHNAPVPDGLWVLHHCDNPPCVRPDHLFLGTHQDNMHDMVRKGRHTSTKKTHCPRGHKYADDNLTLTSRGARACRQCSRAAKRRSAKRFYWKDPIASRLRLRIRRAETERAWKECCCEFCGEPHVHKKTCITQHPDYQPLPTEPL